MDSDSLFTAKDVGGKKLKGDQALRQYVVMPKDICVALTEETDGSVFNVLKLTKTKPFIGKKFSDVFSRVVAMKAEPSDCQKCECVADETGVGMPVCRSCITRSPLYKVSN